MRVEPLSLAVPVPPALEIVRHVAHAKRLWLLTTEHGGLCCGLRPAAVGATEPGGLCHGLRSAAVGGTFEFLPDCVCYKSCVKCSHTGFLVSVILLWVFAKIGHCWFLQ